MRYGLQSRIEKLEQAEAGHLVWVVRMDAEGNELPLKLGEKLTPFYLLLPEVCATSEEWLNRYSPLTGMSKGGDGCSLPVVREIRA